MRSIITLAFLAICNFVFAQNASSTWNTVIEHSDFEIKTLKQNCSKPTTGTSKEYLFLEVTNHSDAPIKLTYKIEKWYAGVCSNCDENSDHSISSIELKYGESKSGNCENYRDRSLAVFSRMTGKSQARELTSYKIIPLSLNGEKL